MGEAAVAAGAAMGEAAVAAMWELAVLDIFFF